MVYKVNDENDEQKECSACAGNSSWLLTNDLNMYD